jgi:5'-3' exonuclease
MNNESDDLICSFMNQIPYDGMNVVVSPDRDLYQLFKYDRKLVICKPGTPCDIVDYEGSINDLKKKFSVDLVPENIRMFKTLTGDSSDNIKGIHLFKKTTASKISKYSLDDVLTKDLPEVTNKDIIRIRSNSDTLKKNWEVIGLLDNIKIDDFVFKGNGDDSSLKSILGELNFLLDYQQLIPKSYNMRVSDSLPDWLAGI